MFHPMSKRVKSSVINKDPCQGTISKSLEPSLLMWHYIEVELHESTDCPATQILRQDGSLYRNYVFNPR